MEKKTNRISIRVAPSVLRKCHQAQINISFECRSALTYALAHADTPQNVHTEAGKLHSLRSSAVIYNKLPSNVVSTSSDQDLAKMDAVRSKLQLFRHIFTPKCDPPLLATLGEFLEGGEYFEEILQQVYIHD
jgi:hypothetical protein